MIRFSVMWLNDILKLQCSRKLGSMSLIACMFFILVERLLFFTNNNHDKV